MKNNPLLKIINNGDVVMIENIGLTGPTVMEICRLKNTVFTGADTKCSIDWLEFDAEILYTNLRLHPSMLNDSMGNCRAIIEIIPEELIDRIARANDMWPATDHMLSDVELEAKRYEIESRSKMWKEIMR